MNIYKIHGDIHLHPVLESYLQFVDSIQKATPIHCHDYYEFFLILTGSCIHQVNGQAQRLKEGSLVFIRPDDAHCYDYDDHRDCSFINIAYSAKAIADSFSFLGDPVYEQGFLSPSLPPYRILSPLEKDTLFHQYEKLQVLSTIDPTQARLQLRSLLIEIFTRYFSPHTSISKQERPLWLEGLLTDLHRKENFTQGVSKIYALSDRSIGHLNRVFRQHLGTTPTQYINDLKLSYAKNLLLTTDMDILEISLDAGYNNLSHFYHLFKKKFDITPADCRAQRNIV